MTKAPTAISQRAIWACWITVESERDTNQNREAACRNPKPRASSIEHRAPNSLATLLIAICNRRKSTKKKSEITLEFLEFPAIFSWEINAKFRGSRQSEADIQLPLSFSLALFRSLLGLVRRLLSSFLAPFNITGLAIFSTEQAAVLEREHRWKGL